MDASLRWINALLDRPVECEEAADLLTRAGFPVEHTESVTTRMGEDIRLDVETTSNRGDCNAHLGLAREVVALTDRQLKDPTQLAPANPVSGSEAGVVVENEAPENCLVYHARIVRGVKVGPSPDWLAAHLEARGDVPRNNIVDATNYVLHELGHPVHAFDLDKLEGGQIKIRYAQTGETMLPLGADAKEIELSAKDLVIADAKKPIALAGVKGGAASSVDEHTTNLLLETATFTPSAVRSSSRRHGIASDSSYRFERQVPDRQVPIASERLLQLILSVAGGEAAPPTMVGTIAPPPTMTLRFPRIKTVLGIDVPSERVIEILDALGLQPHQDGDNVSCTAPIGRADLTREIDLIEEVARIHGLESLPVEDATNIRIRPAQTTEIARRMVRDMLVGFGAYETVSHTLVSEAAANRFLDEGHRGLRVDDERAGGTPILRPSLIDTLTTIAGRNLDASGRKAALFEVAAVFHETENGHEERTATALLMPCEDEASLQPIRGFIDRIVSMLTGEIPHATAADRIWSAPGADLQCQGRPIGHVGLLSSEILTAHGLEGQWAAFELFLEPLLAHWPPEISVSPPPAFPAIERDLSLVVSDHVQWHAVSTLIEGLQLPAFDSVEYVGVFRGKQVCAGQKSLTLRLRFRAEDRTLTHEEVDAPVAQVVEACASQLNAELRQ